MTEVICIDDTFPQPVLDIYKEFGVKIPLKDKIYTIREIKKHTTEGTGVLLNEIVNPNIPVKHPVLGWTSFEPTFNIKRFATLLGQPVVKEEVEDEVTA